MWWEPYEDVRKAMELLVSSERGDAAKVKELLQNDREDSLQVDVNFSHSPISRDPNVHEYHGFVYGYTPLHAAAEHGHVQTVMELLLSGADTTRTLRVGRGKSTYLKLEPADAATSPLDGRTPLDCAKYAGHTDVVAILKDPTRFIELWRASAIPSASIGVSCPPAVCMAGLPFRLSGWNGRYRIMPAAKNGKPEFIKKRAKQARLWFGCFALHLSIRRHFVNARIVWEPTRNRWMLCRDFDGSCMLESLHADELPIGDWHLGAHVKHFLS